MCYDMMSVSLTKTSLVIFVILLQLFCSVSQAHADKLTSETEARELYMEIEVNAKLAYWRSELARWEYETNLTDFNRDRMTLLQLEYSTYMQDVARNGSQLAWETFGNQTLKRIFKCVTDQGISAMNDETKLKRLYQVLANMNRIYSTGTVSIGGKELSLYPGLVDILSQSRDYNDLLAVWKGWRDAVGRKLKPLYSEFVRLQNEAISYAGYEDTGSYWRLPENVANLSRQLAPLYKEIHAYIRHKLKSVYGAERFPESGHIPAHLIAYMWRRTFPVLAMPRSSPAKFQPHLARVGIDRCLNSLTINFKNTIQNYTAVRMVKVAEEFFTSLGLPSMPETFWTLSMFVKPTDGRNVNCHPSAWNFVINNDVRCHYEGLSALVQRTEDDFDPGSLFHIPGNVPYIRYFVAAVLKFQIHNALCKAANHTGPPHTCDIYQSKEAGDLLRSRMSLGSSNPWPDFLEIMAGKREMNAQPLVEYFQPLFDWLKKYNVAANENPGWISDCPKIDVKLSACDSSTKLTLSFYATVLLSLLLCLFK